LPTNVLTALKTAAGRQSMPDGSAYRSLALADAEAIARQCKLPLKDVELAALENNILPERYARNRQSFSLNDQARLLQSSVVVVGLGGLGGTVVEILARTGVGRLRLIDGDRFEESNLNRQLICRLDRISQSKARAAADHVRCINAAVEVDCRQENLTAGNAAALVAGADVAVDCLDNIEARFMLEKASRSAGIPLISAAVAGTCGQLTTIFPEDPGLSAVYGDPDQTVPVKGAEAVLGNLAFTVSAIAALEAAETVSVLLHRASSLRNRMLFVDLKDYTFETLRLR